MDDIYNFLYVLKKIEIIYVDKENSLFRLRSHIKMMDEDRILIEPPVIRDKSYSIPDGSEIKIVVYTETGIFSGESKIIGKNIGALNAGVWITYPYNSKHIQRREYLRAPIEVDFDLILYKDKTYQDKKIIKAKARNICGRGLNFVSDEPLTGYYDIECIMFFKDREIKTRCEHIYSQPDKKGQFVNALAFIDIDDKESERIVKDCFLHHLKAKRKLID